MGIVHGEIKTTVAVKGLHEEPLSRMDYSLIAEPYSACSRGHRYHRQGDQDRKARTYKTGFASESLAEAVESSFVCTGSSSRCHGPRRKWASFVIKQWRRNGPKAGRCKSSTDVTASRVYELENTIFIRTRGTKTVCPARVTSSEVAPHS